VIVVQPFSDYYYVHISNSIYFYLPSKSDDLLQGKSFKISLVVNINNNTEGLPTTAISIYVEDSIYCFLVPI